MKGSIRGTFTVKVEKDIKKLYHAIDPEQEGIEIVVQPGSKFLRDNRQYGTD